MDLFAKNRCIIKADILEDKNTKQFPTPHSAKHRKFSTKLGELNTITIREPIPRRQREPKLGAHFERDDLHRQLSVAALSL
jgi:hypothetical protein